jgi:DNA-binding NarL/FixJ family response regulator
MIASWSELEPREQRIAQLLLEGCENADIAKRLRMAKRTVKGDMTRMFKKCGVKGNIIKRVRLAVLLYRLQRQEETIGESHAIEVSHPDRGAVLDAGAGANP